MSWLTGAWSHDWQVAVKALLMYATAVACLRFGERRTLSQWTLIDVVAAVAVGAIVGRTAVAGTQSYASGAVALITILVAHRLASLLRFRPLLRLVFDHKVRVLVVDGQVRHRELRRCGLTEGDLDAHLRERGVFRYDELRYVLYESKGTLTVVRRDGSNEGDPALVRAAVEDAAGYP